jgi:hypothetical protein
MSATVPSGDSQSIGSGEVGFTEPLNVAGEYNVKGEFNFDGPVTGTFTAIRPLEVASGETLAIETTIAGSPLNLAGELNLTGELKLTDSPSITFTGIRDPPKPGLISAEVTFQGGRVVTTEAEFNPTVAFSAPPGGGSDGTIDYEITTTGIRAGADVTTPISASFDGIRAGATALPTTPSITFTSDKSGAAQADVALANTFFGIRAGADGTITSSINIVQSEPIISGTFGPGVTPLTIGAGQSVSVAPGATTADAPINVAGTLNITGEVAVFDQDSSIIFSSDKSGSAQANFAPALVAAVQTQTAQPLTQPLTPTLSASGDNDPLGTQETSGIFLAQPDYDGNIAPPGVQAYTFTPGMRPVSADANNAPVIWRVTINETEVIEDVYNVRVIDTVNPFGSYAVVYADDSNGVLFDKFTRGTRVDIAVSDNQGVSFENRFTGYVVEARERDDRGADALEVECYTYDQFLRRNNVTNDQTGKTISQALADIIQNDTPVTYVANNVNVGDDKELTQSFQGEPVEEVLRTLSFKSVNEIFGVDRDGLFFFRPNEETVNPRGISNTQWFDYDIPREGKNTINEVEVFYDNNDKSVVVEQTSDKLDLKDGLGLPKPGTQREEIARPDLTDIQDAEEVGQRFLQFRNETLTGEVITYGLYDLEPGDVINIEIEPRGIDGEFAVAEVDYSWVRDETTLTIVEKTGDVDEVLFQLSDTVKRLETADANRQGVSDKLMRTESGVLLAATASEFSGGVVGDSVETSVVTNTGLNIVRDAFITGTNPTLDTVKLGDSNLNLSRASTDIDGNELATGSVSNVDTSTTDAVSFEFDVTPDTGDVFEIGLFTSTGALFARLTTETPIAIDDVRVTIAVDNDPEVSRGVFTADGLALIRDIIADNTPSERNSYAFGSSTQAVAETDTALISETTEFDTGSISFVNATGEAELQAIGPDLSGDVTLDYKDGGLTRNRTAGWIEIPGPSNQEYGDIVFDDFNTVSGSFSGGQASETDDMFGAVPQLVIQANLPYDADEWFFNFFGNITGPFDPEAGEPGFVGQIHTLGPSFQEIDSTLRLGTEITNRSVLNTRYGFGFADDSGPTSTVFRGLEIDEATQSELDLDPDYDESVGTIQVDGVYFRDRDFSGEFPTGTFDPNTNTYGAPSLYNGSNVVTFDTFTSPRLTDTITVQSTWNNVSNGQYLEMTDGNGETIRANNTANHVFEFAQESETFTLSIFLDEFAGDPTTTPSQFGDAQKITSLSVSSGLVPYAPEGIGSISTRALLEANTIDGTTVAEGGIKANLGATQLTRVRYAEFEVLPNQRLVGNEIISIKNNAVG